MQSLADARAFRILCQPDRLDAQCAVQPALKVNRQLGQCQIPVLHRHRPFRAGVLDAGVEQLEQAVFVREGALGFGQLPELSMHRLDDVGGVDDSSDVVRVAEEHRQVVPLPAPGLQHDRVLLAPFVFEPLQR